MSKKTIYWGFLGVLLLTLHAPSAWGSPTLDKFNDWLKQIFVPSAASPLGWSDFTMREMQWDPTVNAGQGGLVVEGDTKLYFEDGVRRFTGQSSLEISMKLVFSLTAAGGVDVEMSQKMRFKGNSLLLANRVIANLLALGTQPPHQWPPLPSASTKLEGWLKALAEETQRAIQQKIANGEVPPLEAIAFNSFLQDWSGQLPFVVKTCLPAPGGPIRTYQSCLELGVTEDELKIGYLSRGIDPNTDMKGPKGLLTSIQQGKAPIDGFVGFLTSDVALTAQVRDLAGNLIDHITHFILGDPAVLPSVDLKTQVLDCLSEIRKFTFALPNP
jgi:hypothetical protein